MSEGVREDTDTRGLVPLSHPTAPPTGASRLSGCGPEHWASLWDGASLNLLPPDSLRASKGLHLYRADPSGTGRSRRGVVV